MKNSISTKKNGRPSVPPSLKTRKKKKYDLDKIEKSLKETKSRIKVHTADTLDSDKDIADKNASIFKKQLKTIRKANKRHDYGEQATLVVYKALLDMVLDLIPVAESNYRQYKADRAAYALNTYVNQAREIVNDMRSIQDFTGQLDIIISIIRKQFTLIVQNLIDDSYSLKKDMDDIAGGTKQKKIARDKIDSLVKNQGQFMQESLRSLDSQLSDLLIAPEQMDKKRKKSNGRAVGPPKM